MPKPSSIPKPFTPFLQVSSRCRANHSSPSLSSLSEQQVIQLILDEKTPSQLLETFQWASRHPNFSHSQSTYRVLFKKLCDFRRFQTVYQMLDEMHESIKEAPDDSVFITIIKGLGRTRLLPEVFKVIDLINKFGKVPSLPVLNSILDALVAIDIDVARDFYRKKMMENGITGDHYTFGILMKGLCLTNKIGEAFMLLQLMKSQGLIPTPVVYNTLIYALCKNGTVDRARTLFNKMENPSDATFNVLISRYCREDNLVQAFVMLEKCYSAGFLPDAITVTKIIEALCRGGRVDEAVDLLNRHENKGGKLDLVAFNTLVKGYCRIKKLKSACAFVTEMERRGYLPSVQTYSILITGACRSEMVDFAVDLYTDMELDGLKPDFTTRGVLIRALCSQGRMTDALELLRSIEKMEGSRRRVGPYNSVIYGFYRTSQWDTALEFLSGMRVHFPRAVERSFRVLNLCERGEAKDAMDAFQQMRDQGGCPSVIVFDCLIHALCEEGRVCEARELLREMVGEGNAPVASTLGRVVGEFRRQGMAAGALRLVEDSLAGGYVDGSESYGVLICHLCDMGEVGRGVRVLREMVERGVPPHHSVWTKLILCVSGKPPAFSHLLEGIDS